MEISGKTKICGIVGDPVAHTLSPTMHNASFEKLNLDFVYIAFKVKAEALGNAIVGMKSLGIHGLNVTMPHKNTVVKYVDDLDPVAKSIGTVNTLLNDGGNLIGYNTDGIGALRALEKNGVDLGGKKALLLGAGGAGSAIAFYIAQEVDELKILNRNASKAERLANALREEFGRKITGGALSPESTKTELGDVDILINATSVGMYPYVDYTPVDSTLLRPDMCVMDIVYVPTSTKLIKCAKSTGAKVISGIEMLVYQAAASFEIWTDYAAPVAVMRQAISNRLSEVEVSIGRES